MDETNIKGRAQTAQIYMDQHPECWISLVARLEDEIHKPSGYEITNEELEKAIPHAFRHFSESLEHVDLQDRRIRDPVGVVLACEMNMGFENKKALMQILLGRIGPHLTAPYFEKISEFFAEKGIYITLTEADDQNAAILAGQPESDCSYVMGTIGHVLMELHQRYPPIADFSRFANLISAQIIRMGIETDRFGKASRD